MAKKRRATRARVTGNTARAQDGEPAAPSDPHDALALLGRRRAPYAELLAEIAGDTLDRFPPRAGLPLVEIGAGAGQLRSWLSSAWRGRLVHTDVSARALRDLEAGSPGAATAIAAAESLPFGTGRVGAVLGLCVFDAIPARARAAAVDGIARVLAPGGRFVHLLDMATLLEEPFAKLAESALVPIPNLFGDPSDHEWPLDIILVKRDWLAGMMAFATRTGHPLAAAFGSTFSGFLDAFASDKTGGHYRTATDAFKALASSSERRESLAMLFASATQSAFAAGHPAIAPLPFHSGRYLASVLETTFGDAGVFRIEASAIIARSAWRPGPPGGRIRYRSLCVGHQRILDRLPRRLLDETARAGQAPRDEPGSALPPPGEVRAAPSDDVLVEAGVFVFVATRV